jgi:3-hydroxyisobutyrate dehydrogenase-like beta-hydroxyacid dehydrogenase
MGTVMARRLLDAGHQMVVHNRTRARAAELERRGAAWADTPADLAARCPVVLGCLLDTTAVEQVYAGPDGLLAGAAPGSTLVEHGTFDATVARRLGELAAGCGCAFVDAPVTGGPEGVQEGTLAVMAGGDATAIERIAPVVASYCASLTHVGGTGAGLQLKLVNQLLVSVHLAAAGEAVALLERLGIDLQLGGSVLTRGWAASAMLERTFALLNDGRLSGTGATIAGMVEVQALVAALAASEGAVAPVFAAAREVFGRAVAAGGGDADPAALARVAVPLAEAGEEHA